MLLNRNRVSVVVFTLPRGGEVCFRMQAESKRLPRKKKKVFALFMELSGGASKVPCNE